ncbi:hypothetical protein DICPUDRAFT_44091 [Dictyostelium purpureum]|uniref:Aminotransferase class I/classII large domain-containing protein n=1 Tax=Dictyostelium purpureum TaxID=5786 RepID=F1A5F7_DICPU|nr:uncharacterized protein DICPUDRAFT_44091 [Dictyostelium purpureum]EGC28569.1 hypothetical protein DICPUDRAFT_44091 [Dictyostelium purpureum]|eukprot:XP_003294901.1 hypothetical protein DICPUDRAFT_44091 [Dictyostelium purpureum]
MDDRGIIPEKLTQVLRNWNKVNKKMNFPKAIYIIPNQNPTGIIYDLERKLEIYDICREWDLLIIEDDPHFFLQFNEKDPNTGKRKLEKSFLSIDQDKRVIRVDTFSKFLSSGIRMGFLTTNRVLIDKLSNEVNASCFHPSGLTQITLLKLFEQWGQEGFDKQVSRVQEQLIERRDKMKQLIDKHLDGLVTYRVPDCGLYYWIKLNDVECSLKFFRNILHDKKVYLGLGISHTPNRIKTPYVRVTFSYMDYEETDIAFKILSKCLIKEKEDKK